MRASCLAERSGDPDERGGPKSEEGHKSGEGGGSEERKDDDEEKITFKPFRITRSDGRAKPANKLTR